MKHPSKKYTLYALLVIFNLTGLINCKEKEKKPEDLGFLSLGEAKDYLLFKPGTWWVYRNSYTNELDSMILTSCSLDTISAFSDKRHLIYENIKFNIESSRDGATYFNYSYGLDPDALNFYINWGWSCQRNGGYYIKYNSSYPVSTCHFYYPFSTSFGGYEQDSFYHTYFLTKKDSMTVKGKTYFDVVSFRVPEDESYPYPNKWIGDNGKSTYYWAKNSGLIKIERKSGYYSNSNFIEVHMNWELTESHIIK